MPLNKHTKPLVEEVLQEMQLVYSTVTADSAVFIWFVMTRNKNSY